MIKSRSTRSRDGSFLLKGSAKADARKAIENVSKLAFQAAVDEKDDGWKHSTTSDHIHHGCDVSYDGSHSSFLSREHAALRGSNRGLFEKLEIIHNGDSSYNGSFEQEEPQTTTATTFSKTNSTSRSGNNKKFTLLFKKKKKSKNKLNNLTADISKEAWICGVCARSFSSYEAAEKHENYHIQEVVADLGWSTMNGSNSRRCIGNDVQPPPSSFLVSESSRSGAIETPPALHSSSIPSSSQPRPDVLRMSTPAISSRVSYMPSNTPALQRNKLQIGRRLSFDGSQSLDGLVPGGGGFALTTAPGNYGQGPPMSPIMEQGRTDMSTDDDLIVSDAIKGYVVLADEALVDVCNKAQRLMLTSTETEAEKELEWLARDKSYYDFLAKRAAERDLGGYSSRFRSEGKSIVSKVQNKFVDAYQLMKEGETKSGTTSMDHYTRKLKGASEANNVVLLQHTKKTLYVNVIVRNSLKVISHELERLAKERWKDDQMKASPAQDEDAERFQKFRAVAQGNLVKLAGFALASDFTPRRIAVQLSNDLYRLLTPRLKKRGVRIETEIEYRVGPYFVLAVNIRSVDWRRLVKQTHRDVEIRNRKWRETKQIDGEETDGESSNRSGVVVNFVKFGIRMSKLTKYDYLAQTLAWFYYLHWIIYTPICWVLYNFLVPSTFREYFLSSVTDEIFYYVEEKGMEMDIGIRDASTQAAFMLSALREIRADGQQKKKKEGESDTNGTILGPLLGPAIKDDKAPPPPKPDGFELPENLEYVGLELDLPIGFRRLRQGFLSSKSTFLSDAIYRAEAKYDNIEIGQWTKYNDGIGLPKLPEDVKEENFIGVEREAKYLMPKSAFVKANMCYETAYIEVYNDYCFSFKKKALTPEVPYGSTFVAWTKFVCVNTGNDTCRLICSVEAEFPNGPPMVARQIKSGMRAGVGELFVKIGETCENYADVFP